jgi:hypothetical protein
VCCCATHIAAHHGPTPKKRSLTKGGFPEQARFRSVSRRGAVTRRLCGRVVACHGNQRPWAASHLRRARNSDSVQQATHRPHLRLLPVSQNPQELHKFSCSSHARTHARTHAHIRVTAPFFFCESDSKITDTLLVPIKCNLRANPVLHSCDSLFCPLLLLYRSRGYGTELADAKETYSSDDSRGIIVALFQSCTGSRSLLSAPAGGGGAAGGAFTVDR